MLSVLRKGAGGWVAKVFLSVLVLSFAVWGVADIFQTGGTGRNAARVGEQDISVDNFRQAYTNELRRIGQQARQPITPEQARAAGIGDQVLNNLVNEAAMDARVASLGLSVSDEEVARSITTDEVFKGPTGQFDRNGFQEILRQNNLTENQYIAMQRAFTARKQLVDALSSSVAAPVALREALHAYSTESRSISYLTLAPEAPTAVPAPTADALKAFYEERKEAFGSPEYRKFAMISLDPATSAQRMQVPDPELRAEYDANLSKYATPEKRTIEQVTFPSPDEAKAASDRIKGGATFDDVMAQRNVAQKDALLGTLAKTDLFDAKIADAAFALASGAVSEPVEGAYSTALVRVTKVEPGVTKPFEQVREELRKAVAERRAKTEVLALHDKIDEARLGGSTLDEISRANQVDIRIIDQVDATGKTPNGSAVPNLPQQDRLLSEAFRAAVGAENDAISSGDSFVWYEVQAVTPARERSFDEARAQVEQRWRAEEVRTRLAARADKIVAELKGGKTLEQEAAALKLEVDQAETTRQGGAPAITEPQATAVFAAPVEGFGSTPPNDAGARLVFRVTAENTRPFDPAAADPSGTAGRIGQGLGNDIVSAYVQKLRNDLGAVVNRAMVDEVIGGGGS